MRLFYFVIIVILLSTHAIGAPRRAPMDIAPKDAPIVAPRGSVIDRAVPAYQPKFLRVGPLAGRYEERHWAYLNTYPSFPFYGYGGWYGGFAYGYYGFWGGGNATGASIQTVGYTR